MPDRYANVTTVAPEQELEALLSFAEETSTTPPVRVGRWTFGAEAVGHGDTSYYREDPSGEKEQLFVASELVASEAELHIAETILSVDGDCLHVLFAGDGAERYRLARVILRQDGIRELSISVALYKGSAVQTTHRQWFYLHEQTTTGWQLVRVAADLAGPLRSERLAVASHGDSSRLVAGLDSASGLLQVSTQDQTASGAFLFADDWGTTTAQFTAFADNPADHVTAIALDDELSEVLVVTLLRATREPSAVIHHRRAVNEWQVRPAVAPGRSILSVNATMSQVTLSLAGHPGPQTLFLSRSFAVRPDASQGTPPVPPHRGSPGLSDELLHTMRLAASERDGLQCAVELVTRGEFDDIRFVHVLSYSSYGQTQQLNSAPMELTAILARGPVAFCLITFAEAPGFAHARSGPERVLLKQSLLTEAALMVASTFNLAPGTMSFEGRSAGAVLSAPLLAEAPALIGAALFSRPLVDPVGVFTRDRAQGSVAHLTEWGDPVVNADLSLMQAYAPITNPPTGSRAEVLVTADPFDRRIEFAGVERYAEVLAEVGASVCLAEVSGGHRAAGSVPQRMRETFAEYAWLSRTIGWTELPHA